MDPYLQVSRDAAERLTEFSDEFRSALALGDFEVWAATYGLVRNTNALKTTFPIPVSAAGYHEFKGDMKYRSLFERSLSMRSKTWQDGVKERAEVIENDLIDWTGEPARMADEWRRLPNQIVMDLLESGAGEGPLLDFYTDKDSGTASTRRLFAADHPYNVYDPGLGTFDNLSLTTTYGEIQSGAFFEALSKYFRGIKGPNGKPLGLSIEGGALLVHPEQAPTVKKALEVDTLIRTVNSSGVLDATSNVVGAVGQANIYRGTIGWSVTDESSQDDVLYAIAAGKPGMFPWVVQQGTVEEIVQDKSSALYANSLEVSISEIGRANAAACLPHRICKVTITG